MAHDVFISYSAKDKAVADAVVAGLEQDALRCWIAPRDLLPGRIWGEAIVQAIATSRVIVLILSEHSNRSPQVLREVELAVTNGTIILPFRISVIDPSGAMAYYLAADHWLDALTPPLEDHISRLASSIRALLTGEPVPSGTLPAASPARRPVPRRPLLAGGLAVAALAAAGILFAALGGTGSDSPPTLNSTEPPTAAAPAPTLTPTPTADPTPTPSSSPSGTPFSVLQPFVPSEIWDTCIPYDTSYRATITQGAYCSYDGVDGVWFELYGSAADLKAAYAEQVETFDVPPETATVTCAKGNGNVNGTWTWTSQTGDQPDQGLLCYKDLDGQAWIEQADPAINVFFSALLKSGDQAALFEWWLTNDSLIEPAG